MEIKVNNETEYNKAKEFFEDAGDAIEVKFDSPNLTKINGNIYGLYVDSTLMYIGERQKGKIANRLNNHLKGCSDGTKSKHNEVLDAYNKGQRVSYKTLLIEPDYERYSLETYLIQNINSLEWNIRDKGGKKIKIVEVSPTDEVELEVLEDSESD